MLNGRWRMSQEKSGWTWLWCYQSSQLHDIGCWKPAFSCPSQEWGLYSFAVYTRLWQYSKREPQTNNSVVGLLLHKSWVVVPSPREIAGNVWNSIDVTNLSGQGFQRRNLRDEGVGKSTWIFCTAKKLPWQGLELCQTFCAKKKSKLEKESTFLQCGNHGHQLSIQHHWCRRRKLPSTIQAVMKKFVRLKIFWRTWRRVLGTSDLGNQQITRDVDFLVEVTSRFGRPVRVNSRFVL